MRIGVVIRPREGMEELEKLRGQVARLREAGHEVWPRLTFESGDAVRMARAAARAGADVVVAVGGDGTINEVVNGLMDVEWAGRLAMIPTGTANDFASGFEIPMDVDEAAEVALNGRALEVDVARANERYFINVSTGGFGATATEETPSEAKRLLGPWAYLVTGVKKFSELRPSKARFRRADGPAWDGEVMLFAVGNAKRTGGGSMLTPRAELSDGELDVLIVPGMPRMEFVALLPDLRAGTHVDNPNVLYFRTDRLMVETEEPLSVNVDGEPLSGTRFDYTVADRRLTIVVP